MEKLEQLGSFTLHPSSAFSSCSREGESNRGAASKSSLVAGTVLSDFQPSSSSRRSTVDLDAGMGIRASPFEPLVHDRNLPKCGRMSPLDVSEYKAWQSGRAGVFTFAATNARSSIAEREHQTPPSSSLPVEANCSSCVSFSDDMDTDIVTWKTRYLQSEVAGTALGVALVSSLEEKRRLRIQLISLEATLRLRYSADEKGFSVTTCSPEEAGHADPDGGAVDLSTETSAEESPKVIADARLGYKQEGMPLVNARRGSRLSNSTESESFPIEFVSLDCMDPADLSMFPSSKSLLAARPTSNIHKSKARVTGSHMDRALVISTTEDCTDVYANPTETPMPSLEAATPSTCPKDQEESSSSSRPSPSSTKPDVPKTTTTSSSKGVFTRSHRAVSTSSKPPVVEKPVTRSRKAKEQNETMLSSRVTVLETTNTDETGKKKRRVSMGGMTFTPLSPEDSVDGQHDAEHEEGMQMASPKRKRRRRKSLRRSFQAPVPSMRTRSRTDRVARHCSTTYIHTGCGCASDDR